MVYRSSTTNQYPSTGPSNEVIKTGGSTDCLINMNNRKFFTRMLIGSFITVLDRFMAVYRWLVD